MDFVISTNCTFCEWPPTQREGGGDSFGVGPLNYNIYSLPAGAGNNGNHCQKKQLRFSQMGLGSCYKAALDSTIHCKVQFMQMARTDRTKYLDKEGLEYTMRQLMMIEIYVVSVSSTRCRWSGTRGCSRRGSAPPPSPATSTTPRAAWTLSCRSVLFSAPSGA